MARKQKKYHYIYKTTCSVSGRYYIGMHSTDNMDDGYLGSGKRLWNSINYHGKENHSIEILEHCDNREVLRKREVELVNDELLADPMCMNLVRGGEGGFISPEGVKKGAKLGGEISGKIHAQKMKTDPSYALEVLTKLKVSRELAEVTTPDWNGRKHSKLTKNLMSEKKKGYGVGTTNTQYGTCWITDGQTNKKIKKEEITTWVNNGWILGRKLK